MADRVFLTGGSGFVGTAIIDALLRRGYAVTALVNHDDLDDRNGSVRLVKGGIFDDAALDGGMNGCDAVIHLVGIIMEKPDKGVTFLRIHFEGTRSIVQAAVRNGVRRYIQMSALGTRPDAVSDYHQTKYLAEQCVRAGGLDWTIFRPSLIYGPGGAFIEMEKAWATRKAMPYLFMPYFGAGFFGTKGAGLLQPIDVTDVARAFVDSLSNRKTIGEIIPIAGPDRITWPQLHEICAKAFTGKKRWVMPIPAWFAKLLTRIVPAFLLPFNYDQVVMSQEDNTTDLGKMRSLLGWEPKPFEPATIQASE